VLSDPQGQIIDKGDLFLCQTQRCHYWYCFSYKMDDSTFELGGTTDGARGLELKQNAKPLYNICPRKNGTN
jgi:hypothetical protein